MAVWYAVRVGVTQWGWRSSGSERAARVLGVASKATTNNRASDVDVVSFEATTRFNIITKKTGKISIKKTGKNLHTFNQNQNEFWQG